jgi:hypothetical protein
MDLGVHLPLLDFRGEGVSSRRLTESVEAAREHGLAAVSSNDHFVCSRPWLDGPTVLAAVLERGGPSPQRLSQARTKTKSGWLGGFTPFLSRRSPNR